MNVIVNSLEGFLSLFHSICRHVCVIDVDDRLFMLKYLFGI